jgi:integrase
MSKRSYTLPADWEHTIDRWLAWQRLAGRRATTLRTRRGQVRVIARMSGTSHPRDIDLAMLVHLYGRAGVSADHRHGQRAALVSFFTWCADHGITPSNPAAALPPVKASPPRPRPAPDQVWSALLACAPPRTALMALLACEAGLRRAEVAGLHYDDLIRDDTGWTLIVHGKGDKQRVVPIVTPLADTIRAYCHGGYVFPGQIDGHLSPDAVGRLVSRLMPKGWTMHKLRHRYATKGFHGTHDILAVQHALGHSSVATTQLYTAVSLTDIRAVSEAASRT